MPTIATKERLEPELVRAAIVVVLGTIMAILETTIVAVALHRRSIDFRVTVSTIQWAATGYLLSPAIAIPLPGWAMHRMGVKRVYMLSLFLLGSMLCAGAWSATNIYRQIGGSLGVAVFAVVLDTQISRRIGVRAGEATQNGVTLATPTQLDQIARAVGHSFRWSWGTCVVGIVPALFLPRTPVAQRAHRARGGVRRWGMSHP